MEDGLPKSWVLLRDLLGGTDHLKWLVFSLFSSGLISLC